MRRVLLVATMIGICCVISTAQEKTDGKSLKERYRSQSAREVERTADRAGHTKSVNSVAIAPNKNWIVTASEDGTAKVWDVRSGNVEMTLAGHNDGVFSVDVSPEGLYIVTGSKDRNVRVWDRKSGECVHILKGHEQWIWCVDYSPDGVRIASSSHDRTTKIWDARKGTLIRTLDEPKLWNYSCAFSSDGKQLLIGYPALAILWDVTNGSKVQSFDVGGHENYIQAVAVSPNGERAATGGLDKTVRHWNVKTGEEIFGQGGHSNNIQSVCYSPDGEWIVSVAQGDRSAKVWRTRTGTLFKSLECPSSVKDAVFTEDGRWLLMACGMEAVLWNVKTWEPIQEFRGESMKR